MREQSMYEACLRPFEKAMLPFPLFFSCHLESVMIAWLHVFDRGLGRT